MSKKLVISLLFLVAGMTSCLNAQIYHKNIQSDSSEVREWLMFKPQIYNYTTQKLQNSGLMLPSFHFSVKLNTK